MPAVQCTYQLYYCWLQLSDAVAHAVDAPAQPRKDGGWQEFHDQLVKEMAATKVGFRLTNLMTSKYPQSQSLYTEVSIAFSSNFGPCCSSVCGKTSKVIPLMHVRPLTIHLPIN